ncbi:MAG TPA: division/cell wall cluster transcriptional repressor MraZ [Candidatus Tripitaka californicus]|uniref:division/cell wall cluster transcriptional repressor MraZ n=1 Tax=Candidatus Tripitaka californicus TaxID=3367616 RepID=UPI004025E6E4|nr:division/cell wall cluster transcriptional repressor MraZ [Planctomycetota bacterium]
MLYGSFEHVLDEKNRVAIPATFREAAVEKKYGKGFHITRGTKQCLFLFTPVHWEQFVNKIQERPFSPEREEIEDSLLGGSYMVECDSQGRIIIPQKLKEFAGLEGTVVFTGLGNVVKLWNASKWKSVDEERKGRIDAVIYGVLGGAGK